MSEADDEFMLHDNEWGNPRCKRCGATDLAWKKHGPLWRLVTLGGKPHVCVAVDAAEVFSEFITKNGSKS